MIPDGAIVTLKCHVTDDPPLDYEKQLRCAYDKDLGLRRLLGGELSCFGRSDIFLFVFFQTEGHCLN